MVATLIAECGVCHRTFSADPERVTTANKQPICLSCIDEFNPQRIARGMPPIPCDRTAYEVAA
jgi:predicted CXXCH cytochrome family protein